MASPEYEHRKSDLLNAARELFFVQGYEKTSVSDIIQKVGVAKGSFYYYFTSKEEILDTLIDDIALQGIEKVRDIVANSSLNALCKLNRVFKIARDWKLENRHMMQDTLRVLYDDKNLIIRHKLAQRNIALAVPEVASIIRQGIAEGMFNAVNPDDTAELIVFLGTALNDIFARYLLEMDAHPDHIMILKAKTASYESAIVRILGAPENSIKAVPLSFFEDMLAVR
ncbi:MAG: TetR/AcrR family transcriptional regulator [Candidatus Auribacter fodinae]|jgi:AcrR family transcriptional regulator|uniref:TetR/AcrR family transcriptional regulator n=1 Tax=Candidatus Auribacter fodinae TaxID=2093366 RepID=A0A3A4QPH3_9BACT|nr:MAG: TetR/AcrR family transcriptional regulator [Candidatus Auribacter fodinae]